MNMNTWQISPSRFIQRGLTLVELMVAMALSLVVVIFIVNILSASSRTNAQSEALSQAQENGRFVLTWLQNNVRKAGYSYVEGGSSNKNFSPVAKLCDENTALDCSKEEQENGPVFKTISFTLQRIAGVNDYDCTGIIQNEGEDVNETYEIEVDDNDAYKSFIKCNKEEIANGVEAIQVLYGYDVGSNDVAQIRYDTLTALVDEYSDFKYENIVALRIAVLTRAFGDYGLDRKKRQYVLLNRLIEKDDAIARSVQSVTIMLPNKQKL